MLFVAQFSFRFGEMRPTQPGSLKHLGSLVLLLPPASQRLIELHHRQPLVQLRLNQVEFR